MTTTSQSGASGVSRRAVLQSLPLALLGLLPRRAPARRPNIVFFLTDDQRQDAMSAYGNRILNTPHMDRIAREGARFTEAFVTNALCGPSRATILTGLYSHAHGVITNGDGPTFTAQPGLRNDQRTYIHELRDLGYHTGLVGKWHLRSDPTGFDDWVILPGQGEYHDPDMIARGMRLKMRGHVEDVIGDQALRFLSDRPKDRPFCLHCHFKAPHRSWFAADRFATRFADAEITPPRTFEDRLEGRPEAVRKADMALADIPDFKDRGVAATLPHTERKRRNLEELVRNYYRVLLGVDENVGRVLAWLDDNDLAQDTIVVYSSDNGFFLGEHGLFDKRLMYEPSIRVPLLMRFPARIKAGTVDASHLVLNVDFAPTLLELCGAAIPAAMHGRSMVPLLDGQASPWRHAFLYEFYEYPGVHCVRKNRGVRTERYKLIHFYEQPEEWELYDLAQDADETRNLAAEASHQALARQLREQLASLRRELGDVDPPGPPPVAAPCGG